jgi:hypothetical protein
MSESLQDLLKKLQYNFYAIFEDKETKKLFIEFMIKNSSEENYKFIEEVNNFKITKYPISKKKIAEFIFENYIEDGSINELNLQGNVRDLLLKKRKELNGEYDNNIFDLAYQNIIIDIAQDIFPSTYIIF